jgi:hypothetical protein
MVLRVEPGMRIMAEGDTFRPGRARPWTDVLALARFGVGSIFALHPDGARVAMERMPAGDSTETQDSIVFVFNFFDEVRRLTSGNSAEAGANAR